MKQSFTINFDPAKQLSTFVVTSTGIRPITQEDLDLAELKELENLIFQAEKIKDDYKEFTKYL